MADVGVAMGMDDGVRAGMQFTGIQALLCTAGFVGGLAPLLLRRDWTQAERQRRMRRYCWTYGPPLGLPTMLVLAGGWNGDEPVALGAWLAALLLLGPLASLRTRPTVVADPAAQDE